MRHCNFEFHLYHNKSILELLHAWVLLSLTFIDPPRVFCPSLTLCNRPDPEPSGRIVPIGLLEEAAVEGLAGNDSGAVSRVLLADSGASVDVSAVALAVASRFKAAAVFPPRLTGAKRLVCFLTPGVMADPSVGSDMVCYKKRKKNFWTVSF
jgi:hypothetical protein